MTVTHPRSAPAPTARRRGRWPVVAAGLAATLAVAGCGDGGQVTPFVATRMLAFGDEASVIDSQGRKYTVNAVTTDTGAFSCSANPLWVQSLAARYGLVFAECNPTGVASPASRILAQPGARAAGVKQQVDAFFAAGGPREGDLATVMAGVNDVLDAYAQYPAAPIGTLVAQVIDAGKLLGGQVNRLAEGGAKVIVSTAIDPTYTPFGRSRNAASQIVDCPRIQGETERKGLLECLTDRFNGAMRTTILNDGRRIGLVLGDALVRDILQFPASGGFINVADPACAATAPLPTCTTSTLAGPDVNGNAASGSGWLWAAGVQLSAGGHAKLGLAAVTRVANNPF